MVKTLLRAAEKLADKTVDTLLPKAAAHASHCVNCPPGPNQCRYFCCGHQISHIHLWSCCMNSSLQCTCQIEILDYC